MGEGDATAGRSRLGEKMLFLPLPGLLVPAAALLRARANLFGWRLSEPGDEDSAAMASRFSMFSASTRSPSAEKRCFWASSLK